MPDEGDPKPYNKFHGFLLSWFGVVDRPVTFFREKVVEPIQGKNTTYYYHRRFRRVPAIDECYTDDQACIYEANDQFKRDRMVENEILSILRQRRIECELYHGPDAPENCQKIVNDYLEAETSWFTKYGDLGPSGTAQDAYMKQKHRMIWERRHGPVGTGMKKRLVED